MDLLSLAHLVNPAMIGLDQLGECSPVMNTYIFSRIVCIEVQRSLRMVVPNPYSHRTILNLPAYNTQTNLLTCYYSATFAEEQDYAAMHMYSLHFCECSLTGEYDFVV